MTRDRRSAIKAALLASPVTGTSGIDAYCRQGAMVLAGIVPAGSSAGQEAVRLARETPRVKKAALKCCGPAICSPSPA